MIKNYINQLKLSEFHISNKLKIFEEKIEIRTSPYVLGCVRAPSGNRDSSSLSLSVYKAVSTASSSPVNKQTLWLCKTILCSMDGERRKRKVEDEEDEEEKMEKFFALIRNIREVRYRMTTGGGDTTKKAAAAEEKRVAVWKPAFIPEDFMEDFGDLSKGGKAATVAMTAAGPSKKSEDENKVEDKGGGGGGGDGGGGSGLDLNLSL
ncbi:uncharacterized protein LOC132299555 [Cornus florida]|uniref:uncharacterized protein LOC132299555 n=1 Tax=Cornus florida TaxID=4283 RepID=UPI002897D552|nr:uncharacterized protein LOC132299555 [Cornus florida]